MKWKPYPEYKESGVEWLGEVPEHWAIKPLRATSVVSYGLGQPPSDHIEGGTPFIRATDIDQGQVLRESIVLVDAEKVPLGRGAFLSAGDIIVVRSGALTGDSAIIPEDLAGSVAGFDMVVRARREMTNPEFVAWQMLSSHVRDYQFQLSRMRAAQPHLNAAELQSTKVCSPALYEQQCVAAFLDRETAKIDTLISKQERLIVLLQEKRQALISRAVTKGLNPNAPMKPSGVEWLGDVPAHWTTTRLAFCSTAIRTGPFGSDLHAEDYVEEGRPVINPANIQDGQIVFDPLCTVDEATAGRLSMHWLAVGDILVGRRGEMGRCAVVLPEQSGWLCGTGCLRVSLDRAVADPRFLHLALQTQRVREWLSLQSVGSTMENLNASILARIPLPLPPVVEQAVILDRIAEESAYIDDLVGKANLAITLMREHRTALISAAVTGKIDVRNLPNAHLPTHA